MFKKFFVLSLLLGAFAFVSNTALAQLTFFNGTPCTVQMKAAAENAATPCAGPQCVTGTYTIAPFSSVTLAFPACFITAAGLRYRAVKCSILGGGGASVDVCTGPNPAGLIDCQNNGRRLQIFSATFAAVY